jgi:hypothetical protein
MPGFAFLARQVLSSKRLLFCGASSDMLDDLVCALQLVSQHNPVQLFWFREAQPMYDFNFHHAQEIEAASNPCVILCDYDVLTQRQYIRLLVDPKCTIIVMTSLPLASVPILYKNSCTCVVECLQTSCFYGNFTDRFFCHLKLHPQFTLANWVNVVTGLQQRFRRRKAKLIVLQRFVKSWLYRPTSRYAQDLLERYQVMPKSMRSVL